MNDDDQVTQSIFMDVCEAAVVFKEQIFCSEHLRELYLHDRQRERGGRARLLCLKDGTRFSTPIERMSSTSWPLELIRGLRSAEGDDWVVSTGVMGDRPMMASDLSLVAAAAGIDSEPTGNVRCTLPIRRYSERTSKAGGLEWLEGLQQRSSTSLGLVQSLINALRELILDVQENGATLYVEQITAVFAKDATAKNTCLTPRLHVDEYYGHRETAVASLLEKGWSQKGGTLFFPTCGMSKFPDGETITPAHLATERFVDIPVVYVGSCDVCIYDGMLDETGNADPQLGLPHISGDVPGES